MFRRIQVIDDPLICLKSVPFEYINKKIGDSECLATVQLHFILELPP